MRVLGVFALYIWKILRICGFGTRGIGPAKLALTLYHTIPRRRRFSTPNDRKRPRHPPRPHLFSGKYLGLVAAEPQTRARLFPRSQTLSRDGSRSACRRRH